MNKNSSQRLKGKKILVTGGSRGIGASIVQYLASEGAHVAFTYSSQVESAKRVASIADEIFGNLESSDEKDFACFFTPMNLIDEQNIETAIQIVLDRFHGEIDGLVNNAGITKDALLIRMKTEDFQNVINVNLQGTFFVTRSIMKQMVRARKGSIVNMSSVIGQTGNPGQSHYAATKAGIIAFSQSLALEVASRGIRINCIAPGFIHTDMTEALTEEQRKKIVEKIPLQRVGTGLEIAQGVGFLLSEESSYITGQTLNINGGLYMG